jgi:steroid delta-isomerase-like uncharacterized protein
MHPREVLESHTEDVWNQGNLDAVETYIAEDYVEHDPSVHDHIDGPEAYRRNVELFRSAFSDLTVTLEDTVVEGDEVAARQRFRGTHEGEFMGVEPTGREIDATSFVICRVEDDRIVETWVETDMLDLLNQLGLDLP